ncbi:hypothetical protein BVX95_00140 [archaeon D22]|nr:hypothetical protein BVX95_00140 [archaeon D22]
MEELKAKDAMIKPVFVNEDDSSDTIIKKLKKEDTNVCIVVKKNKEYIGEIRVEDLITIFLHQVKFEPLTQLLNHGYRREIVHKTAKDLINKYKSTALVDTPINEVIEKIYEDDFDYIPVLDEDKKVVGVVTPSSVLSLLEKR